jgi:cytosine/adenosine deaminase-related metal-dependent hydrolase
MSSKIMQFLTDWLRWHVAGRVASPEDLPKLASRCIEDAARQGISRAEIESAIGPLEDCIRQALLKVRK